MTNYKMRLHGGITELQAATKRGELPREVRLVKIEQLTEEYFANTGDMPDGATLERLANLCLYEELADDRPDKMTIEEYPIMSENQYERRTEGRHVKKGGIARKEVGFDATHTVGSDGINYGVPTRRKRDDTENRFVDRYAKTKNRKRQRAYAEFTRVQPVISYKLSE